MKFEKTIFDGVILIKPNVFPDDRGLFFESYQIERFKQNGIDTNFVQDNTSVSAKGVLRGMHLQVEPYAQGKLVRVPFGAVLDVIVDIRPESKSFLKHDSFELNSDNHHILWIPPGFAHGFLALHDQTVFSYKCTNLYHKESERSIRWNDPELNIEWPIETPLIAEKDKNAPLLSDYLKELK